MRRTSALDLRHQVEVLDLIARLTADGALCTLVAIHDLTLAAQYCDEVVLLHDGRMLGAGPPVAVYAPELLEAAYGLPVQVTTVDGTVEVRPRRPAPPHPRE